MTDVTFVDKQTVIDASWLNGVNAHINNKDTSEHPASKIAVTPVGNIAATDVQSALAELDNEKYNKTDTVTNATNVVGTIASGVTGTTQSISDNSTKIATTAYVDAMALLYSNKINTRQTVMSGAVDVNGYANVLSIGTGLIPKLLATTTPVRFAFAYGYGDYGAIDFVGTISIDTNFNTCVGSQTVSSATNSTSCVITTAVAHNLAIGSWVTLSGFTPTGYNGTYQVSAVGSSTTFTIILPSAPGATTVIGTYTVSNFLYVDRNISSRVLTLGSTILPPDYVYSTVSTTSNKHTFYIPTMTMYVGNGSTSSAVQRVFVGEANAGASTISSVLSYAFNGLYYIPLTALPTAGTRAVFNHNIGVKHLHLTYFKECTTAGEGYSVGDRVYVMGDGAFGQATVWYGQAPSTDSKTVSIVSGANGNNFVIHKTTGVPVATPTSVWSIGGVVQRGF